MFDQAARLPRPRGGVALRTAVPLALFAAFWAAMAAGSELRMSPIVKAVERARASVVNIRGEKTLAPTGVQAAAAEAPRRVNGMGTGVIIDPRGYILTNYHVVDGVREIQVTLGRRKALRRHAGRPRHGDRPGGDQDRRPREVAGHPHGHVVGPDDGRIGHRRRQRLRL